MSKLIIYKGLPACGKSTDAAKIFNELGPDNCVIANKDNIRLAIFNGVWTQSNEKITVAIHDKIIKEGLSR
jgi:tRNA uridine 5-carbamoylmethylation protein Kti12